MSAAYLLSQSVMEVAAAQLYAGPERLPARQGVLDPRLGMATVEGECATCRRGFKDCPGHFGYVLLPEPLFHNGLFRRVLSVLQSLCLACSRLLAPPPPGFSVPGRPRFMQQRAHFEAVVRACRAVDFCPRCDAPKRPVRRLAYGVNKIIEAGGKHSGGAGARELAPREVARILGRVAPPEWRYLLLSPAPPAPGDLLVRAVPVPPIQIRPSVPVTPEKSNEDDLTIKLFELLRVRADLLAAKRDGRAAGRVDEQAYLLQLVYNQLINAEASEARAPFARLSATQGVLQRLKGKPGRLRGNLQGKRVEHSARTVISPDPNRALDEVGLPRRMAAELTFPERVTPRNLARLRGAVENGPFRYPGATHLECAAEGGEAQPSRYFLGPLAARAQATALLAPGMTVHRHLRDDDVVLFNRQPSLHRQSIMAFRARVSETSTLSFNECLCAPFNADFDGDEMNVHVLQTWEARAEATCLLSSARNLLNARNGEANIGLIQDFFTTLYLLTEKTFLVGRAAAMQVLAATGAPGLRLPPPCVLRPRARFSGKQLFSCVLRGFGGERLPRLWLRERFYRAGEDAGVWDAAEGAVVVAAGELLCGRLGKAVMGGARGGIVHALISRAGPEQAARLLAALSRLSARLIEHFGVSFVSSDVQPAAGLRASVAELLRRGFADAARCAAGDEAEREAQTAGVLNALREEAGRHAMEALSPRNNALLMAQCGAKGSALNICQMTAMLGQQMVLGRRVPHGFLGRTLPHFARGDDSPAARGFVASSFAAGLAPVEFFFHTMAGREGLIDTAVKTADTGYMQRRLMKVMEDLAVEYDFSVRNSEGRVVQYLYGEDGFDPAQAEGEHFPLRLEHFLPGWADPSAAELAAFCAEFGPRLAAPGFCNSAAWELVREPRRGHDAAFLARLWRPLTAALAFVLPARTLLVLRALYRFLPETPAPGLLDRLAAALAAKAVAPGEAVGAVASQSLGEPCTQMTLKTFHFAGVASMNVTLGVPRINEIFNALREIRTSIIEVALQRPGDARAATEVRNRLSAVSLAEVVESAREVLGAEGACLVLRFDTPALQAALPGFDLGRVRAALLGAKLRLRDKHVRQLGDRELRVDSPLDSAEEAPFYLRELASRLGEVVVYGLRSVRRALLGGQRSGPQLFAEGTGLAAVLRVPGVDAPRTRTNNIQEAWAVLGVEAARTTVIRQTHYAMSVYGIAMDFRHLQLLADTMSFTGRIVGLNRYGIGRMKNSPMMLASFETVGQVLFDAAFFGARDAMRGVSERIIIGERVALGTGKFEVLTA